MSRVPSDVYFSPGRGAAQVVVGFIERTAKTLDVAVYSITMDAIADALIRAHQRGVRVRVLTDKSQAAMASADASRLAATGIPVRIDTQPGIMHNKFCVCDRGCRGKYALLTGSFNWTANADERNAENFVVLRQRKDVEAFSEEFERLWALNIPK